MVKQDMPWRLSLPEVGNLEEIIKGCGVPGRTCLDLALGPVKGAGSVFQLLGLLLVWS